MDAFKLVLPSNVSYDHFPNNTSSHYCTYLHNAIQLEGKWEVAAESIYYSANIENENEKASISFLIVDEEHTLINNMYSWQFKLSPDQTWLGFLGVALPTFTSTSDLIDKLNSCDIFFNKPQEPLFQFTRDKESKITYRCKSPNFSLEIHPHISEALGFSKYKVTFTGTGPFTGKSIANKTFKPDTHNHHIHFFHNQLVHRKQRITVKFPGEKCDPKTLEALWSKRLLPHLNTSLKFSDTNKVVFNHFQSDIALVFSPEMARATNHLEPLIRHQTRWAYSVYRPTKKMEREHWYVDIYNTEMQTTVKKRLDRELFIYRPRLFPTVVDMITFLNESIISMLKAKLKDRYNVDKHTFTLTASAQRITINLGSWLRMTCSSNAAEMLGFDERIFEGGQSYVASSKPLTAQERVQRVLLMTDIIESISYGNRRLRVLQDFVHKIKGRNIIEKRFQPLSFLPVLRNYIDRISIQLVNEEQEQITANDVKTVVVLHFQRLK